MIKHGKSTGVSRKRVGKTNIIYSLNPSFLGNIKKKVDKVKGLTEAFLVFEAFLPKGWESGITITSKIIGRYGLVGILLGPVLNAFAVYNALLIDEKLYKIKARMFGLVSWVYGHPKFEMLSDDVKGIREWKGESEVIAKKILWKEEIEKTWNDCDKMIEQKVQEYEDYLQKKGLLQTYRRNGIHIGVRAKENYKLMVRESTNNDPQELFRVIKSTIMNKISDRSKQIQFDGYTQYYLW